MEIFVSYRRSDSAGATGRLTDRLRQRFGEGQVFRDLDGIEAGADFARAILDAIRASSVLLLIIGRSWTDSRHPDGRRRLDDSEDYVRREIEAALEAQIPVIPVLVEGAAMPSARELCPALAALALRHAHELTDKRWDYDCGRLLDHLQTALGVEPVEEEGPRLPPPTFDWRPPPSPICAPWWTLRALPRGSWPGATSGGARTSLPHCRS
ncbi:MAG: toll/interleukin-1 receptor domain-containing protein [Gammaproteobacteria bacterium]